MVVTSVALPRDLHRKLTIAALDGQMALTELLRQAAIEYLERHQKRSGRAS